MKFRDLPIGAIFEFFPDHPESKYYGATYRKVSARKFVAAAAPVHAAAALSATCAASAGVRTKAEVKQCKICPESFSPKTREQVYCSLSCAGKDTAWVLKTE